MQVILGLSLEHYNIVQHHWLTDVGTHTHTHTHTHTEEVEPPMHYQPRPSELDSDNARGQYYVEGAAAHKRAN